MAATALRLECDGSRTRGFVAVAFLILASLSTDVGADCNVTAPGMTTDPESFTLEDGQVLSKALDGEFVLLGLWPAGVPSPFDGNVLLVTCPVLNASEPDLRRRLLGSLCESLQVGDVAFEWNGLPADPDSEHPDRCRLESVIVGTPVVSSTILIDGFESGDVSEWSTVEPPE